MNIDLNNIDDLFFDSLENFEVEPSATVKEKIKKRIFYHNLVRNTYFQLFIVAFFSALLTSLFWYYGTNNNNNMADTVNVNSKNANTIDNNISTNADLEKKDINTNKTSAQKKDANIFSNNISETKIENNNTNEKILHTAHTKITKNIKTVNNSPSVSNNNIEATNNNVNEPKTLNPISSDITETSNNEVNSNKNKVTLNIEKFNTSTNINAKNVKKKQYIGLLKYKNSILLTQQINSQIIELPKLQIPDDTIGYNMNNEPIVMPSNHWYADLYFSPNYSNSKFTNNNKEFVKISNKLNIETSPDFGYNIGINVGYKFKNFAVNAGVGYSKFIQKLNAKYNEQVLTSVNYYNYTNHNEWQLDTTFYWNIDSLLQGDSVLTPIIDSTQITLVDSTLETRTDTSINEKSVIKTNKYQYVDFPLTIEYVFNRGKKLSPFINGGLITGLLIKTSIYTYEASNGNLIQDNDTPYIKPNFWLVFGGGIRYNINNKYSLLVYPYYRYNLKSIIKSSNIYGQKINVFGVNFGVRYTF